jgi:hypothetical protein
MKFFLATFGKNVVTFATCLGNIVKLGKLGNMKHGAK